jgi:hypothetical protein
MLRMSGAVTLLLLYDFMACTGTTFYLTSKAANETANKKLIQQFSISNIIQKLLMLDTEASTLYSLPTIQKTVNPYDL